jgi:F-type H+-transporting ATPase subunit a
MDVNQVLAPNDIFTFEIFGHTIPISDSIIMMWIVMAIIIILSLILVGNVKNYKTIPEGKQIVVELIVGGINKLVKSVLGRHWKIFAPYFGTVIIFIAVSNMIGLFDIFPSAEHLFRWTGNNAFVNSPHMELIPPTKDLNVTVGLAMMSMMVVAFGGIRVKGVKGWLKTFVQPLPVMAPFHVLDYFTRTISLSLRLFGNILAGVLVMGMMYSAMNIFAKIALPVASFFFDIFDALLQAYIFVFLSMIYLNEVIE